MGFDGINVKKKSISYNLLRSGDVLSAIKCIKKLGSKIRFVKNRCEIIGNGLDIKSKKFSLKCWKFWNFREAYSWFND